MLLTVAREMPCYSESCQEWLNKKNAASEGGVSGRRSRVLRAELDDFGLDELVAREAGLPRGRADAAGLTKRSERRADLEANRRRLGQLNVAEGEAIHVGARRVHHVDATVLR